MLKSPPKVLHVPTHGHLKPQEYRCGRNVERPFSGSRPTKKAPCGVSRIARCISLFYEPWCSEPQHHNPYHDPNLRHVSVRLGQLSPESDHGQSGSAALVWSWPDLELRISSRGKPSVIPQFQEEFARWLIPRCVDHVPRPTPLSIQPWRWSRDVYTHSENISWHCALRSGRNRPVVFNERLTQMQNAGWLIGGYVRVNIRDDRLIWHGRWLKSAAGLCSRSELQ